MNRKKICKEQSTQFVKWYGNLFTELLCKLIYLSNENTFVAGLIIKIKS